MNSAKDQGVSVKYWMDDRLRLALLKESSLYRKFWDEYGDEKVLSADHEKQEYCLKNPVPKGELRCFVGAPDPACPAAKVGFDFFVGLNSFDIAFKGPLPTGEKMKTVLDILNPYQGELPDNLPFYFHEYPPVAQLIDSTGDPYDALKGKVTPEHHYIVPTDLAIRQLQPWQRLLRIDLSRSKKDIMKDVGWFLDRVAELKKEPVGWSGNYALWQTDVSRARKEVWRDLEIWRMRRGTNKKTFPQISRTLRIKVDAAKKAFAHAYFLIEGHQYDPERFKQLYQKSRAKEVKLPCDGCQQISSCDPKNYPCPDLIYFYTKGAGAAYVAQVEGKQTERLTSTGIAERLPSQLRSKTRLTDD